MGDGSECVIDGCAKPMFRRKYGWCQMHYTRWKRHCDPETKLTPSPPAPQGVAWSEDGSFHLPKQWVDIRGQRYGLLVAVKPAGATVQSRGALWIFKCDCGNACEAYAGEVRRNERPSCGCLLPANMAPEDRFWSKVDRREGDCWEWRGNINEAGYGRFVCQVDGQRRYVYAHREAYALTCGPIPDGLTVDHRCLNTRCVNPEHLGLETSAMNATLGGRRQGLRQTHCKRGHPYNAENTRWTRPGANGRKYCGACDRLRQAGRLMPT